MLDYTMTKPLQRKLHIVHSPAQTQIVCGSKSKFRNDWSNNTQDVTSDACVAVVEYLLAREKPVHVQINNTVFQLLIR